jgi:hypothetical protein
MLAKAKNGHANIWAFFKLNFVAEKHMVLCKKVTTLPHLTELQYGQVIKMRSLFNSILYNSPTEVRKSMRRGSDGTFYDVRLKIETRKVFQES